MNVMFLACPACVTPEPKIEIQVLVGAMMAIPILIALVAWRFLSR